MSDALLDAVTDTLKLTPILYITYLFMEYIEHHMNEKINRRLENAKKAGPVIGALFGLLPQCGFSGAASGLFTAGTITTGTLFAVFIATSDEMLPILISAHLPAKEILLILLIKLLTGIFIGYLIDLLVRRKAAPSGKSIHSFCEQEHCSCEDGHENIFLSALKHTVKIVLLIFIVTLALNLAFLLVSEEKATTFSQLPVINELLAALIGLVPNCSSSVLLTNLYVKDMIGIAPLLSGLMANAGVGLLVLYRVNKNKKENILITVSLYGIGVVCGLLTGTAARMLL